MKFLRILLLLVLATGTLAQDGFDLSDALDDLAPAPTPLKPKDPPKPPPKTDFGLDLSDAFGPDVTKAPPPPPKKPDSGGFGDAFDLGDALGPDPNPKPKPDKPAVNPGGGGGGGGNFGDEDLFDVNAGGYKPDPGHGGGGGGNRPGGGGYDEGGEDKPQEAGGGAVAGIVSAIGVALMGAVSSYVAYQKKKLCFKIQGGVDPESGKGHQTNQNDPQVFSNLLRTS